MSEKAKITKIINSIHAPIMKSMMAQDKCDHHWEAYGFGFKCVKCGYYSGLNEKLNKELKKLLTHAG